MRVEEVEGLLHVQARKIDKIDGKLTDFMEMMQQHWKESNERRTLLQKVTPGKNPNKKK